MASSEHTQPMDVSQPDPALKRLEKLVGKWELKGRTLTSDEDNITGWTTFEWMPGGFFLKVVGEMNFKGFVMQSLEIIGYDPERKKFSANVYSSMSGDVLSYEWDVQGNTVIHSGSGATYTGTLSEDGQILSGGWRPDAGTASTDGAAYDAIMTRVNE
ncbi:DUF1579 family protein [Dictyobacter formicarum]|uniref:DUF1579 domain-containing protein n=1 Tax=Dictyobacter formicarum TaxID=2778368 RepID=A0ABQ3VHQ6_9CHLR|nr:DUF1579 family protein [Dictyobacter formicarum]GHO85585.1 hypothetical protein KSZ_35910 [Dictyobacter formicarum]